jgi:single-strand DNA-binding protein
MSFHTILIIGHLGRDPEMRYTPAGQAVTNFNLASNRQYTDANGQPVKETIWVRVATWGKTAENCNQYLQKGSLVLVEGRLVCDPDTGGPRLYSRLDGTPSASFELSANTVRFLSGREGDGEHEPTETGSTMPQHDDIPF